MSIVRQCQAARRDLVEIVAYLAERSESAARRFRIEAEATIARLAGMPGMGARLEPNDPIDAVVLYFPVSRFRKYLVFYRPLPDGIEILRVLHGARDIASILEDDLGVHGEDDDAP